jgi:hypothetical protein
VQAVVAARLGLRGEVVQQVRTPLAEVDDPRCEALGVERETQRVDRRLEQLRRDARGQQRDGAVGGQEVPGAVDDDRRIRLVGGEHPLQRGADRPELGLTQLALRVHGRVARGKQQPVALAQRDVQALGEVQDHLLARPRAPGLDEAQVARRDAGLQREVELAEAALRAPRAEQGADRGHYL